MCNVALRGVCISACWALEVDVLFNPPEVQFVHQRILQNVMRVLWGGFGGGPEEKRPLGRPKCRWEDNIKTDLEEVECVSIDWVNLA
jgi:hypothetical protein